MFRRKKDFEADDREQLHKDARKLIDDNLSTGEDVKVIILGDANSAMIGTDRRVFVFKKGIASGATFGAKFNSFQYQNITGVQANIGMLSGFLAVQGAGINDKDDDIKAPHTIRFSRANNDLVRRRVALLGQLVAEYGGARDVTAPDSIDIPEQIKKLADLKDVGILSDEEFDDKKADLLSRM